MFHQNLSEPYQPQTGIWGEIQANQVVKIMNLKECSLAKDEWREEEEVSSWRLDMCLFNLKDQQPNQ